MDRIRLRDGRSVLVREIRADDGARLQAAHERLSPESQYRRFLGAKRALSDRDARYLADVDGVDHYALVVSLPESPDEIIGVARYVRVADEPECGEFSIVLGDPYQGQGLGAQLLRALAEAAIDRGIERFAALVLADNVPAHRLIAGLTPQTPHWQRVGTVDAVSIDLAAIAAERLPLAA